MMTPPASARRSPTRRAVSFDRRSSASASRSAALDVEADLAVGADVDRHGPRPAADPAVLDEHLIADLPRIVIGSDFTRLPAERAFDFFEHRPSLPAEARP